MPRKLDLESTLPPMSALNPDSFEDLGKIISEQIIKVGTNCCQTSGWHQCADKIGHKNLTVVLLLSKEIIL